MPSWEDLPHGRLDTPINQLSSKLNGHARDDHGWGRLDEDGWPFLDYYDDEDRGAPNFLVWLLAGLVSWAILIAGAITLRNVARGLWNALGWGG